MSEQARLVRPDPTPARALPTTSTECTLAAKFLLGWDPVPFIFPETPAECYVDEILWATKVAIEAAAGVEREVARGELPVTVETLRARAQPDSQQATLAEVADE